MPNHAKALIAIVWLSLQALPLSPENYSTFGTLIGAFGNSNGIVVFTDSRAAYKDAAGTHPSPNPAQKLMRFDDSTVCAIAGLGSSAVHVAHELDADILGVIAAYRDAIQKEPRRSIQSELGGISGALTYFLNGIAEINAKTGFERDISDYHLLVLLVGYDLDGVPKIGVLDLKVAPQQQPDGSTRWVTSVGTLTTVKIENQLTYLLGGMYEAAQEALKHPENFSGYEILQKYHLSMQKDRAASISVDDLEELGRALVSLTAERHPKEVGGGKQVAVLSSGRITRFVQPGFVPPRKPFSLVSVSNISISYLSMFDRGPLSIPESTVKFYEGTRFIGASLPPPAKTQMSLDHSIFVNCTFSNMALWYNGGTLYFDSTNKIENSDLAFGPEAFKHPDQVHELQEKFSAAKKP